jgi:aminomethyltransferase
MFAVQGPRAQETLQALTKDDLSGIRRYRFRWTELLGGRTLVARTGYTGEDGFEVMPWNISLAKPSKAIALWEGILDAGKPYGIEPCGLGARDTLRLEAGMCLYGADITQETTPFEARLDFVVQLEAKDFIGREALAKQKKEGVKRLRAGLRMIDRGIPRAGCLAMDGETVIGKITSGTLSPTLQRGVAMAYIPTDYFEIGRNISVRVREKDLKAEIVDFPFFDINRYGWRRKTD